MLIVKMVWILLKMYRLVTKNVLGTSKFTSRGFEIDMDKEWEIYDFETLIKEKTGISIYESNREEIMDYLKKNGVEFDDKALYWRLVDILWKTVRKSLGGQVS